MINLDNLGGHQKGRLWINDFPEIKIKTIDTIQKTVEGVEDISKCSKSVVLELLLPRNASNYALLGVTYTPLNSKKLDIVINVGTADDVVLKDNIAFTSDEVHIGIPAEYALTIIDSAVDTLKDLEFPSGILFFDVAAHGHVGSSKMIFSRVTKMLVKIISKNVLELSESELKELVALELNTTSWGKGRNC